MSVQSNEILGLLENEESKVFIIKHLNDNPSELALKYANKVDFNLKSALDLLSVYRKSRNKLPSLTAQMAAMTDRSYQQASSERIAAFKAKLLKGQKLLDMTGGLGVDAMAFAKHFEQVLSVDTDEQLNELVNFNLKLMNLPNVKRITQAAEDAELKGVDWAYLDPDRRKDDQRFISVEQLQPNLKVLVPKLLSAGVKVAVKMSPLFEIQEFVKEFPDTKEALVLSEKGEVKEVLYLLYSGQESRKIHAVEVAQGPFHLTWSEDKMNATISEKQQIEGKYIYLPKAALSKSRLANHYLQSLGIQKLKGLEVYYSTVPVQLVGVRAFEVLRECDASIKSIKNQIKSEGLTYLNLMIKGSRQTPAQLAKKLGIKEGGKEYLLQLHASVNRAFICRLLF